MEDPNKVIDNTFSNITFLWIFAFVKKELFTRSPVGIDRLPTLPPTFGAQYLYNKLSHYWATELKKNTPKMWIALIRTFRFTLAFSISLALLYVAFELSLLIILNWLIRAIGDTKHYDTGSLLAIAGLLTVCALLSRFVSHTMEYGMNIIGMKCRILLTTAIYEKIQSLSYLQVQRLSFGNILTVITSDLFKFDEILNHCAYLIIAPIGIALVIGLSYIVIGWPAFLMIIMFVIHLFLEFGIGTEINRRYRRALEFSDVRNKQMREFIEGIQLIKTLAWEYVIADAITKIRRKEFLQILSNYFFKSLGITCAISFPTLYILAVCLSAFATAGGDFSTSRVFGFLSLLFLYLRIATQFNEAIAGITELNVCVKRAQQILMFEQGNEFQSVSRVARSEIAVRTTHLVSGRFNTTTNELVEVLRDVSFSLKRGELISVIGRVGAGKSSLLLSLLNEIQIIGGVVEVNGTCAYVPQEAWILPISVRENITYGRELCENWYDQVLTACCLAVDMEQLPEGDLTVVGERGVTLSGGQKARISLARAVYANYEIYLLDDPLSAVDTAVAKQLLSIFTTGILSKRTVVLVTHQLQFILQTGRVLLIEEGKAVEYGKEFLVKKLTNPTTGVGKNGITHIQVESRDHVIAKQLDNVTPTYLTADPENSNKKRESAERMSEEITHLKGISLKVFGKYIWNGGQLFGIVSVIVLGFLSYFNLIISKNYLLVWWIMATEYSQHNYTLTPNSTNLDMFNPLRHLSLTSWICTFFSFSLLVSVFLLFSNISVSWTAATAAYRLHNKMLWKVLRAPSNFFDSNSTGSIINRFSKDIATMDHLLPKLYIYFFFTANFIIFTLIAAFIGHWLTVFPSILLLVILMLYRYEFVRMVRQIKRIESAAKSDVISHLSLTLHGLTTIHSLGLESYQNRTMYCHQNTHSKCWRVYFGYLRFFTYQIDSVICIYMLLVSVIMILLREQLTPVVTAFVLSQIFNLLNISQYSVQLSAEVEMNMVSVERVLEYTYLPEEPALYRVATDRHSIRRGEIEFSRVDLRYSFGLPLALKDISFRIRAGERVGIVGRTGAGKSSIPVALLRLVEIAFGSIRIDGVNTMDMGLHELRNQISIIPQNPVLFSGALKYSLDPIGAFGEDQLWRALDMVQLREKIAGLKGQLKFIVSEGGSNFSVGERQLLCLARSILKQSKIVVLDEATSNVDTETDGSIQEILESEFSECTVLTIAHRVHTVMKYDRIIVMENGRIIEFDSPRNLLKQPKSKFYQLANV